MANKKLLGLLVLCLFIYVTECGRFGGGRSSSRSSSRGGSTWGRGWGGSSSSSGSSWSKPSSSSSSWGSSGSSYKPSSSWNTGSSSSSSWGSNYKPGSSSGSHGYPSSTGLSGSGSSWSKPSSSSSGSYGYPSSSSGSGSGFGSHSYPSNTGLSGSGSSWNKPSSSSSGFGSHSYPSSTGLSGSGSSWNKPSSSSSGAAKYPSSSTGLSGSGSGSHSYPSGTGLSGSGSTRYPSGTHSYPSGTGLSGSGSNTNYNPSFGNNNYNRPKPTYNTNSGYNTNTGYHGSYQPHYIPTYYTAPQHVYVTQYRDSGSRYSDLLTGLTLYNMGRSHSYHDHYYVDDYHRHRYMSTGSYNNQQSNYNRPNNEATCSLRIKENGKLQELKVPCEIVSTFTEGSKKVESDTRMNKTVCTTNTTVTKTTPFTNKPTAVESSTTLAPVITANVTEASVIQTNENKTELPKLEVTSQTPLLPQNTTTPSNVTLTEATQIVANVSSSVTTASTPIQNVTVTETPIIHVSNKTNGNVFTQTVEIQKSTETIVNVTVCTTIESYIDPLTVKGGPIDDQSIKECSIDIKTKEALIRHTIECATLMEYSKMRPPAKDQKPLLPSREKLKSWMEKPPWWLAMFIAV